jgi:uncharacterized membrane protein YcaP (DUF421 family)
MQLVLRAAVAYWLLLFSVRLIGRRSASQMAPFDLVILFMTAGISIAPVLGDDHSMVGAFSALCTIGLMHILASWLKMHSDWFGRIVDGTPVVVFEHGEFNSRRMRVLRLTEQDIMTAARQRGLMRLEQVRYAVAERDGKISIVEDDKSGEAAESGDDTGDTIGDAKREATEDPPGKISRHSKALAREGRA